MGSGKKSVRQARQMQTRTKSKNQKFPSLDDPASNNALLTSQLRSLGLYAAPILGDGNCLFRALSDQLFGVPSHHLTLRKEICDWMAARKERYEPFVEDDRGLDVHLRNMREQGTYGGHLELSAFAHLKRRNVKVIQPGLVYVIEWAGGSDPEELRREEKRRKGKGKEVDNESDDEDEDTAVYVAYHDWEHFSSVRNLKGPHQGRPHVVESSPAPLPISKPSRPSPTRTKSGSLRIKLKPSKPSAAATGDPAVSSLQPTAVPLPRSVSPSSDLTTTSGSASASTSSFSQPPATPPDAFSALNPGLSPPPLHPRASRSPKRSFDESEGADSVASSGGGGKRPRGMAHGTEDAGLDNSSNIVDDDELEDSRSDLSSPLTSPGSTPARVRSPSPASHPHPPPLSLPEPLPSFIETPPTPQEVSKSLNQRPLTRRQRKLLGLPKPRPNLVRAAGAHGSSGKIVVPGGKHPKRQGKGWVIVSEDDEPGPVQDAQFQEWVSNGNGRVDVRGFRELKI
ncbi:cysteine proteinase [Sistotremastrum suecicum HHB10207 ss-3]|uniref:Cysteine proteinase n=1 Tax=Sistotremastrum suecicum HHB10207 ss-3 TaxID=1314776 RepID=A0A166A4L0_9AGAM|nr:cysteine proteinase [Sistotremastrum suecicum HHB10207 ss-3]